MTMKELSGLASDYLEDIDILEEAKETLRKELAEWWKDLSEASSDGFSRLKKENKLGDPVEEDKWIHGSGKNEMCLRLWLNKKQFPLFLSIEDPITVKGRDYRLILKVTSKPELTKLKKDPTFVKLVNKKAKEAGLEGLEELDWARTSLATHDVRVVPNKPEATKQSLIKAVGTIAQIVIAAYQLKASKQTS